MESNGRLAFHDNVGDLFGVILDVDTLGELQAGTGGEAGLLDRNPLQYSCLENLMD